MLDRKFCSVCGIEIPAERIKTSYCSDECRKIGKDTSKLRFKTAKKNKRKKQLYPKNQPRCSKSRIKLWKIYAA